MSEIASPRPELAATRTGTGVRGVAPGHYRIVPSRSTVGFRVRKLGLFTVAGTFAVRAGTVEVVDGAAHVQIDIDAGSFTTANKRRNADVRGPNFLDADTFGSLTWTGVLADGTSTATGTLRVRGVSAAVPVEVVGVEAGPAAVTVRARAVVDRFETGVTAARGIAARTLDAEFELTLLRG